jgi:hypothetical protein
MINLTTVGCSFTYAQMRGWPHMLADRMQEAFGQEVKLQNNGMPGAGNRYIGDKLILDSYMRTAPDLAIIMWSGLTRKDVSIDHEDQTVMSALEGYGYVRWSGHQTSYVLSGGIKGSWEHHPATKEIFDPLYKYSNERSMAQDTLVSILSLQSYLKQRNIPYIMSSYVNYWTREKHVGQLDFGIHQFQDLKYLVDQIDFSQWLFANNRRDGIYELAMDRNDLQDDGFHPNFDTHAVWADMLLTDIKNKNLLKR